MNIVIDTKKGINNPHKCFSDEKYFLEFQKHGNTKCSPNINILKKYKKIYDRYNNDSITLYINRGNKKLLDNEQ
jgi:hypothetical protein